MTQTRRGFFSTVGAALAAMLLPWRPAIARPIIVRKGDVLRLEPGRRYRHIVVDGGLLVYGVAMRFGNVFLANPGREPSIVVHARTATVDRLDLISGSVLLANGKATTKT